ncbi:hypothetical protein ACE5IS_19810 [Leptospira wolffii]|uniref:Restriction endonuclease type IV Mrr domain-containing protein n=1 Tax=Leptospira wolffii TaxID=409998 RepID=A0ABV5BTY0_9LEPT
MKEDILEQIAEDYFISIQGNFTKHNLKFRPREGSLGHNRKYDSVHSDIDLIVINTKEKNSITVVSCKSWQEGFNANLASQEIEKAIEGQPEKVTGKRDYWCYFRELCINRWTDSFVSTLRRELSISEKNRFTLNYIILCTKLTPKSVLSKDALSKSRILKEYFRKFQVEINLEIVTIDKYIRKLVAKIENSPTNAVESTHLSRTLQLLMASGYKVSSN